MKTAPDAQLKRAANRPKSDPSYTGLQADCIHPYRSTRRFAHICSEVVAASRLQRNHMRSLNLPRRTEEPMQAGRFSKIRLMAKLLSGPIVPSSATLCTPPEKQPLVSRSVEVVTRRLSMLYTSRPHRSSRSASITAPAFCA